MTGGPGQVWRKAAHAVEDEARARGDLDERTVHAVVQMLRRRAGEQDAIHAGLPLYPPRNPGVYSRPPRQGLLRRLFGPTGHGPADDPRSRETSTPEKGD